MKTFSLELRFLTPALVGGAYPKTEGSQTAVAELRPSSIRGMLRWWHRFVVHDHASEQRLFGCVAGDEGRASGFTVRVINPPEPIREPKTAKQLGLHDGQVVEYLAFNLRQVEDARSVLPEDSRFRLVLINRRLPPADWEQLIRVARCFGWLGSLGTRSRRCFGALEILDDNGREPCRPATWQECLGNQKTAIELSSVAASTSTEFLKQAGRWLKEQRDSLGSAKREILGSAGTHDRLASPVLLRPVKNDGEFRLVVIGSNDHVRMLGLRPGPNGGPTTEPSSADDPVAALLAPPFDFPSIARYKSQVLAWQAAGESELLTRFVELTQDQKYAGLRGQPWYPVVPPP